MDKEREKERKRKRRRKEGGRKNRKGRSSFVFRSKEKKCRQSLFVIFQASELRPNSRWCQRHLFNGRTFRF